MENSVGRPEMKNFPFNQNSVEFFFIPFTGSMVPGSKGTLNP